MPTPTGLLCGLLLTVLIVQTIFFWRPSANTAPRLISSQSTKYTVPSLHIESVGEPWDFDAKRDGNNIALTPGQCNSAFPDLYAEIDRSVKLWRDKQHNITSNDTSITWRRDAAFRLLIHDNSLRILETRNSMNDAYRERTLAVLHQLHKALLGASAAGDSLPTIEFAVTVDDMSLIPNPVNDTHAIWAFTRRLIDRDQERCWLMPDFNFFAGPDHTGSFYETQRRARENNAWVLDKIPKVVWRGAIWTNQALRGGLLRATEGKAWADVAEANWETKANLMSLEGLCKYAFVIHTEGRSWSGRLKYLLNCDSVPIVHQMDWTAHYYHLLVPTGLEQNYVPVKRDWSDLEKKVQFYLNHLPLAQKVADSAIATFRDRYLTAAAESCYWRRLIHGYSQVAEEPQVYEVSTVDGMAAERLRGISFEEFVLLGKEWPPLPNDSG